MIWRFIKGILKLLAAIILVLGVSAAVAVGSIELDCRPAATTTPPSTPLPIDDPGYRRIEANTYFTFPEWYIVYSFEDFGRFLETKPESQYPYLSQIAGFWKSYCGAHRIAVALPGDHFEYKMMIHIIGISYTYELAIKGAYENTIGRFTEWLRGPTPTPEDEYARKVVQEYGAFMHQVPWYKFPFMERLRGLWQMPFVGASPTRNIERKLALSAEYLVKAGYARLIALGLDATSGADELEIMFVTAGDPAPILTAEPAVRLVRMLPDGNALLVAPRYAAFTDILKRLAASDTAIVEIAGNRRIMLSAIVPAEAKPAIPGTRQIFSLPIDASPGFVRVGYDLDVSDLSPILQGYAAAGIEVEHVYDY